LNLGETMTAIRKLARFIVGFHLSDAPDSVLNATKRCIQDTIGVAIGASLSGGIRNVIQKSLADAPVECGASLWGLLEKLSPSSAALYNAMMAHYLELDDVHPTSKTHIGAVVVPAAWAMSEYLGASGRELLESVICGYEAMSRIGMGIGVAGHRNRGWHATGTAGTFGAAAACSKLLNLDEDMTVYALGMAGTQSSGLWSFLEDGATCKILHAGTAARNGMTAALMASAGMTGAEHILDAVDGGMFAAMSDDYDFSAVSRGLGSTYEILNMETKPYPCCRSTHCAIDAALALVQSEDFSVDKIERIDIATYLVGYRQCGSTDKSKRPVTTTEAKFSTPYAVACVLLYGEISEKYFSLPYLKTEKIINLCQKIKVYPDQRFTSEYPEHWGCELTAIYRDGNEHLEFIKDALGSRSNPVSDYNLRKKIMPMLTSALGEQADIILNQISSLETLKRIPNLSSNISIASTPFKGSAPQYSNPCSATGPAFKSNL